MIPQALDAVLKKAPLKRGSDGWEQLDAGVWLTLYLAHNGVSLTISRVGAIQRDGDLFWAKGAKNELFAFALADLFAVAIEREPTEASRRTGFV